MHQSGTPAVSLIGPETRYGVYEGPRATEAVAGFSKWQGPRAEFAVDFLANEDWSKIANPDWWLSGWEDAHESLVLAVPLLPEDPTTSIQIGATGAYDKYFTSLGESLVAHGLLRTTLRLGWEFNGDWYRWTAKDDPQAFVTYWRHVVDALRAVPGQQFTFDWNPAAGPHSIEADRAYPGDEYVDVLGLDVYDWKWGDTVIADAARWDHLVASAFGLQWQADFARMHGKRTSIPEWGVASRSSANGGGGGDNPMFVRNMFAWIKSHDVAYAAYFDADRGNELHKLRGGAFPRAAATFQALASRCERIPRAVGGVSS